MAAIEIIVKGIVQGVGFRPFVYQKAVYYKLMGTVRNDSSGVFIHLEGKPEDISCFLGELKSSPPPLSVIKEILTESTSEKGYTSFIIEESTSQLSGLTLLSPDIAVCKDCLKEIEDINEERRFQYAFTNCTNCGPRYSIIKELPYDRKATTMKSFEMCPSCNAEYKEPLNRRFHAQPTCCKTCGPSLSLLDHQGNAISCDDPLLATRNLLKKGHIIAIKGLGGFHLVCNALFPHTIELLRKRKNRKTKPLALMMKDLGTVLQYCCLTPTEEGILTGCKKPVLLLKKKATLLPHNITFDNPSLGVMLPYTPLHYMLFDETLSVLVATSANRSGIPMVFKNEEALDNLHGIADYFLIHDRDIHMPVDDSVVKVLLNEERVIRPARGYAPLSLLLPSSSKNILALGSELKNTFCLSAQNHCFISPYIGDMTSEETLKHFTHTLNHLKHIYKIEPEVIVYDHHPGFWHHSYIKNFNLDSCVDLIGVYHHHAHIAGCLAENNINEKVIGIAFDGVGYGEDGLSWGSELMLCDKKHFKRVGHLAYFRLPGGDMATLYPSRMGLSLLYEAFGESTIDILPPYLLNNESKVILSMLQKGIHSPLCCSMGRLFDGVAALLGFNKKINYEGEACIFLENLAMSSPPVVSSYKYSLRQLTGVWIIDYIPVILSIMEDLALKTSPQIISRKFHNTLGIIVLDLCEKLKSQYKLNKVALSGGVFQNELLFTFLHHLLIQNHFEVFTHKLIPCNDSGLSFGQLTVALEHIRK